MSPTSTSWKSVSFTYNGIDVILLNSDKLPVKGTNLKLDIKNPTIKVNGYRKEVIYEDVNTSDCQFSFSVMANDFDNFFRIIDGQDQNYINRLVASIPTEESQKAYSQIEQLPDCAFSLITINNRIRYLKWLAGEFWLNQDQEYLVIMLIDEIQENQIVNLINFLKEDRTMLDLCKKVNDIGGEDNYSSFVNVLFEKYFDKFSDELDIYSFQLPSDHLFYWMDKGLLERISYKVDYKCSENKFAFSWRYRLNPFSNPVEIAPFEIIAVNFETDISFINLEENKKVVLMPAFVLAWLINQDIKQITSDKIEVGIKIVEFIIAFYTLNTVSPVTKAALKAYYYLNAVRTGANLILLDEITIEKISSEYDYGEEFISAYEMVNDVWGATDFTVNWFSGNVQYFTAFTIAYDHMVQENPDVNFETEYPDLYYLVTETKKGLE